MQKKPLRAAVFIGARKFKWSASRKAGLSVLLRNGVFGGRILFLTPRDLLRKEKPLRNQLQIMGKL
ncbi:MAG: hypothetical protein DMG76_15330 [Acidobacteria bacterium]|nr:MAG: hypothetical protein DMG76_15330 [Acidobacteriota bacterium]